MDKNKDKVYISGKMGIDFKEDFLMALKVGMDQLLSMMARKCRVIGTMIILKELRRLNLDQEQIIQDKYY